MIGGRSALRVTQNPGHHNAGSFWWHEAESGKLKADRSAICTGEWGKIRRPPVSLEKPLKVSWLSLSTFSLPLLPTFQDLRQLYRPQVILNRLLGRIPKWKRRQGHRDCPSGHRALTASETSQRLPEPWSLTPTETGQKCQGRAAPGIRAGSALITILWGLLPTDEETGVQRNQGMCSRLHR